MYKNYYLLRRDTVVWYTGGNMSKQSNVFLFRDDIIFHYNRDAHLLRNVGSRLRICTALHRRTQTLQNNWNGKPPNTSRCPLLYKLRYFTDVTCKSSWESSFVGPTCFTWKKKVLVTCLDVYLLMVYNITLKILAKNTRTTVSYRNQNGRLI
jgi:hypothetical protein